MIRLSGWAFRLWVAYRRAKADGRHARRAALRNKSAAIEARASITEQETQIATLQKTVKVLEGQVLLYRTVIENYQAHQETQLALEERARVTALRFTPKDEDV